MTQETEGNPLEGLDPTNAIAKLVRTGGTVGLLVTDESGSMQGHENAVTTAANKYIESLREAEGNFFVGGVTLSDQTRVSFPISHSSIAEMANYRPGGGTLLFVTVFRVLEFVAEAINSVPADERSQDFHCVIGVYTDGDDTNSMPAYGYSGYPLKLQTKAKEVLELGVDLATFGFGVDAVRIALSMGFPLNEEVCLTFNEVSRQTMETASQTMTCRSTQYRGPMTDGLAPPSWLTGFFVSTLTIVRAMGSNNHSIMFVLVDASSSIDHLNEYMEQALNSFCPAVARANDGRQRYVGMAYFDEEPHVLIPLCKVEDAPNVSSYPNGQGSRLISTIRDLLAGVVEIHDGLGQEPKAEISIAVFTDGSDSRSSDSAKEALPELVQQALDLGFKLYSCGIGRPGEEVAKEIGFPVELAFTAKRSANELTSGTSKLARSWTTGVNPSSLD